MVTPLSTSSSARRSKRYREKLRDERDALRASAFAGASSEPRNTNAPTPGPAGTGAGASSRPPPPSSPPFPLHDTTPIGGASFLAPAFALLDGSGMTDAASDDAPAEPVVPPVPEPPPPPPPTTSPDEAAMIAKLMSGYLQLGLAQIAAKRPELVAQLAQFAPPGMEPRAILGAMCGFYEQAAHNLALKYNIRIPYQDEFVVAVGLGIATWGFASKPSDAARVAAAKDANAPAAPAPSPAVDDREIKLNV